MKFLIASDIHGSYTYCKALIEAYKREKADRLLLLGDILYHGPRNDLPEGYAPKDVIALLNEYKSEIFCVRGNCDTEVDQMVLSFPVLADYAVIPTENAIIYATHGHNYNSDKLPPLKAGDILLHGHTHIPCVKEYETHTYINPGSVSIPKEGSPHSYILFDGKTFVFKDLDSKPYMEYSLK